jgi:hypothetical protein
LALSEKTEGVAYLGNPIIEVGVKLMNDTLILDHREQSDGEGQDANKYENGDRE